MCNHKKVTSINIINNTIFVHLSRAMDAIYMHIKIKTNYI